MFLTRHIGVRERPVNAFTWQQQLARAGTPGEVISIARNFVASIDHDDLARLPGACRPGKLFDTQDVMAYAYELVRHDVTQNDTAAAETIDKLASFFSQAAVRLAQLTTASPPGKTVSLFR